MTGTEPAPRIVQDGRKRYKVNPQRVAALRAKGLSTTDIGKIEGVDPSTVWRFLERSKPELLALERFKANRADALATLQGEAMDAQVLVAKRIKKDLLEDGVSCTLEPNQIAKYGQVTAMMTGIAFDKERLERGESTQNISTVSRMVNSAVSTLYKRKPLIDQQPTEPVEQST